MTVFLQQLINGVSFGLTLAMFAVGFSLVLANLNVFHVAHAAIFSWGAVAAWLAVEKLDLPFALAVILAVAGCAVANGILYLTIVRPILPRRDADLQCFIASIGGLLALSELANLVIDRADSVRFPAGSVPVRVWHIGSLVISSTQVVMTLCALACLGVLHLLLTKSHLGRVVAAVSRDRETASSLGIPIDRVFLGVFAVAGGAAAVAGILVGLSYTVITPTLGSSYLITAVAAMVIGGIGNTLGVGAASVLIGIATSLTAGYVSSQWSDVVIFGALILVLVVRPRGLFRGYQSLARA